MNKFNPWLFPVIFAGLLFTVVRPIFAQAIEEPLLSLGDITVGSESRNGYHQVFYSSGGIKIFITEGNLNATSPVNAGEYIVYRKNTSAGADGIFLYNLTSANTIQLSASSNNANPVIDKSGRVAWEGWVDTPDAWVSGAWQIFLFDGTKVIQLTSGDLSLNLDIEGDNVIYGRKDVSGIWRAVVYSVSRGEAKDITTGITAKHPALENGKIILGRVNGKGGEEFPLTVEDLFLLDLAPLASDELETVTEEEIIQELNATSSATLEATPSGEIQP